MPEVIAHGELLIDFVPTIGGQPLAAVTEFERAAGGAPGNVAAGLARLGVSVGFLGQVGDDAFGHFLESTLADCGVETQALEFTAEALTGLAFVSLTAKGERDFVFYRSPSADMLYARDQIDHSYLRSARLLHIGSISMIAEPARSATLRAVEIAREAGMTVSLDPNLRLNLWPDSNTARAAIEQLWPLAQIIKISEEELDFLTDQPGDLPSAARDLWHPELQVLFVTQGECGCTCLAPGHHQEVEGFEVPVVDTTGAGDGFVAGALKGLLAEPEAVRDRVRLRELCRYANAVGALTTTRRGAIPALPSAAEVEEFMQGASNE